MYVYIYLFIIYLFIYLGASTLFLETFLPLPTVRGVSRPILRDFLSTPAILQTVDLSVIAVVSSTSPVDGV